MARNKQTQNTPIPLEQQPFRLPENWQWVRLGEICTKLVDGDHNPPKGELSKTEYIMCSSTNINNNQLVDLEKVRYLSKETFVKANERTQVSKGDILLTTVGSLGRSCIYNGEYNICFQRSVSIISTQIFNKYLKFFFDTPYFQHKIESEAKGTAQKGFYLNQLEKSLIPVAPLSEQHRIVEKIEQLFTQLDQAAEKLTAVIDGFELRKTAILHKAYTGKLVPQNLTDEPAQTLLQRIQQEKQTCSGSLKKQKQYAPMKQNETPFRLPENWVWVYLVSGFDITSSKRVHKKDWLSQGVPFYRTRELVKLSEYGYVDNELFISQELYDEFAEKYGVPAVGDLLVSGVGTIGVPYIVNDKKPFYFKDGNVIWLKNKGLFNPKYVFYFYKSEFMYNYIHNMSAGTTVDTYTIINATKTPIPLPPLAEQKRIVEKIEQLLEPSIQAKKQAEDALQKIALIKKAILAQAFRGEL